MASIAEPLHRPARAGSFSLAWAFVERQTNLWKRYWAWEIVWLVYGVVNTLAITFIAKQVGKQGSAPPDEVSRLILFLLIGTLVWAYLSAVLDDISLVVTWERWEGTIEHTLMAPVPRVLHLLGMSLFGVLHAIVRTLLIFAIAVPFFDVQLGQADWVTAAVVLLVGSFSIAGLAILAGVLPLLYPERGTQMSFMVQALVLLVSGVYYEVGVLPPWLRVFSHVSPATYILDGIRGGIIDGNSVVAEWHTLLALVLFGAVLIPLGMMTFAVAEVWAKKTGKLKRQG
ncbi:MAG TPA: ABC transporter permease [Dehalococcoidia bacterium]|jgi:ABC-2 type transport system permease protein|nr:ABC transporter permease [Dehalococcoidia bacterium]